MVDLASWTVGDATGLSSMRASLFEAVTGQVMASSFTLGGVADRMVLVASELATHMLSSGTPPATVRLCRDGADFVLDVAAGQSPPPPTTGPTVCDACGAVGADFAPDIAHRAVREPPRPEPPDAPAESRLWLRLAQRLSTRVGAYTTGDTRHVWALFEPEPATEQAGRP